MRLQLVHVQCKHAWRSWATLQNSTINSKLLPKRATMQNLAANISVHLLKQANGTNIQTKLQNKSTQKFGPIEPMIGFFQINKREDNAGSICTRTLIQQLQNHRLVLAAVVRPKSALRGSETRVRVLVEALLHTLGKPSAQGMDEGDATVG